MMSPTLSRDEARHLSSYLTVLDYTCSAMKRNDTSDGAAPLGARAARCVAMRDKIEAAATRARRVPVEREALAAVVEDLSWLASVWSGDSTQTFGDLPRLPAPVLRRFVTTLAAK